MPITQILLTATTVSQPPEPTYTLTPAANDVNEGSELTFNVGGTNIPNGTYYWTIQTNAGDFATTSGEVVVTDNSIYLKDQGMNSELIKTNLSGNLSWAKNYADNDNISNEYKKLKSDITIAIEKFNVAYRPVEVNGSKMKEILYGINEFQ